MLRTLENMLGSTLIAKDGEIGSISDFYLEDASWSLRSPDVSADRPVSRQREMLMNNHYGWHAYWAPDGFLTMPDPVDREPAPAAPLAQDLAGLQTFQSKAPVNRVLQIAYYDYFGKLVSDADVAVLGGLAQSAPQAK